MSPCLGLTEWHRCSNGGPRAPITIAWNASTAVLPRRVDVPVQSTQVKGPRNALLPPAATSVNTAPHPLAELIGGAANKNDGCHVEQNWAVVRTVVGYHRYDTAAELLLLNEIWQLQSKLTNYFYPQQKLISKVRDGAKVAKKHDTAATPFHRAIDHPT